MGVTSVSSAHAPLALPPWTETLGFDEACALLDIAAPGMTLAAWEAAAQDALPQASRKSRTRQLRFVRGGLLDHDGETVRASRFLSLVRGGSPALRRDLVLGRHLLPNPWVEAAARELVLPLVAASEKPLAPHDVAVFSHDQWCAYVAERLPATASRATVEKTRTTALGALASLGVVRRNAPTRGFYTVRRGRPDPRAFGWLVGFELTRARRSKATDAWVASESTVAALFAVAPSYAVECIEVAVAEGLLERSYIAGVPRVRVVPDAAAPTSPGEAP